MVFHHQHGINQLARACHPHFVAGLTLGGGYGNLIITENLRDSHCLAAVARARRSGVSIDVADVAGREAGVLQTQFQGASRACDIRRGDMVAVSGEAPAYNLGQDRRTTLDGALPAFHDDRRTAAAGDKAVPIAVEGAARLFRSIFTDGEGLEAVERSHAIHIRFLGSTANNAVLQTITDEQVCQTYCMRTRGTGAGCRKIYTPKFEEASQIHGDCRVHRLEDSPASAGGGVSELAELVEGAHRRFRRRIIAIKDSHFMRIQIILV